jgi:hypothetical protein
LTVTAACALVVRKLGVLDIDWNNLPSLVVFFTGVSSYLHRATLDIDLLKSSGPIAKTIAVQISTKSNARHWTPSSKCMSYNSYLFPNNDNLRIQS